MSSIKSPQRLRINATVAESVVDGPGIRYVIFVQGCPHRCEGCHNPQTHDFDGGRDADIDAILADIHADPLLSGVTFSGGEPFCHAAALARIAHAVHAMGRTVITYSGYTYEQLLTMAETDASVRALLSQTDTLIDGPFVLSERDLTLPFRGSRNQRIIDLHAQEA